MSIDKKLEAMFAVQMHLKKLNPGKAVAVVWMSNDLSRCEIDMYSPETDRNITFPAAINWRNVKTLDIIRVEAIE